MVLLHYLPVAVTLILLTCALTSKHDGLLRTIRGSTVPLPSSTLYVTLEKFTTMATRFDEQVI